MEEILDIIRSNNSEFTNSNNAELRNSLTNLTELYFRPSSTTLPSEAATLPVLMGDRIYLNFSRIDKLDKADFTAVARTFKDIFGDLVDVNTSRGSESISFTNENFIKAFDEIVGSLEESYKNPNYNMAETEVTARKQYNLLRAAMSSPTGFDQVAEDYIQQDNSNREAILRLTENEFHRRYTNQDQLDAKLELARKTAHDEGVLDLMGKMVKAQEDMATSLAEIATAETKIANNIEETNRINQQIADAETAIAEAQKRIADAEEAQKKSAEEIAKTQAKIAKDTKRLSKAQNRTADNTAELTKIQEEIAISEERLAKATEEQSLATKQIEISETRIAKEQISLRKIEEQKLKIAQETLEQSKVFEIDEETGDFIRDKDGNKVEKTNLSQLQIDDIYKARKDAAETVYADKLKANMISRLGGGELSDDSQMTIRKSKNFNYDGQYVLSISTRVSVGNADHLFEKRVSQIIQNDFFRGRDLNGVAGNVKKGDGQLAGYMVMEVYLKPTTDPELLANGIEHDLDPLFYEDGLPRDRILKTNKGVIPPGPKTAASNFIPAFRHKSEQIATSGKKNPYVIEPSPQPIQGAFDNLANTVRSPDASGANFELRFKPSIAHLGEYNLPTLSFGRVPRELGSGLANTFVYEWPAKALDFVPLGIGNAAKEFTQQNSAYRNIGKPLINLAFYTTAGLAGFEYITDGSNNLSLGEIAENRWDAFWAPDFDTGIDLALREVGKNYRNINFYDASGNEVSGHIWLLNDQGYLLDYDGELSFDISSDPESKNFDKPLITNDFGLEEIYNRAENIHELTTGKTNTRQVDKVTGAIAVRDLVEKNAIDFGVNIDATDLSERYSNIDLSQEVNANFNNGETVTLTKAQAALASIEAANYLGDIDYRPADFYFDKFISGEVIEIDVDPDLEKIIRKYDAQNIPAEEFKNKVLVKPDFSDIPVKANSLSYMINQHPLNPVGMNLMGSGLDAPHLATTALAVTADKINLRLPNFDKLKKSLQFDSPQITTKQGNYMAGYSILNNLATAKRFDEIGMSTAFPLTMVGVDVSTLPSIVNYLDDISSISNSVPYVASNGYQATKAGAILDKTPGVLRGLGSAIAIPMAPLSIYGGIKMDQYLQEQGASNETRLRIGTENAITASLATNMAVNSGRMLAGHAVGRTLAAEAMLVADPAMALYEHWNARYWGGDYYQKNIFGTNYLVDLADPLNKKDFLEKDESGNFKNWHISTSRSFGSTIGLPYVSSGNSYYDNIELGAGSFEYNHDGKLHIDDIANEFLREQRRLADQEAYIKEIDHPSLRRYESADQETLNYFEENYNSSNVLQYGANIHLFTESVGTGEAYFDPSIRIKGRFSNQIIDVNSKDETVDDDFSNILYLMEQRKELMRDADQDYHNYLGARFAFEDAQRSGIDLFEYKHFDARVIEEDGNRVTIQYILHNQDLESEGVTDTPPVVINLTLDDPSNFDRKNPLYSATQLFSSLASPAIYGIPPELHQPLVSSEISYSKMVYNPEMTISDAKALPDEEKVILVNKLLKNDYLGAMPYKHSLFVKELSLNSEGKVFEGIENQRLAESYAKAKNEEDIYKIRMSPNNPDLIKDSNTNVEANLLAAKGVKVSIAPTEVAIEDVVLDNGITGQVYSAKPKYENPSSNGSVDDLSSQQVADLSSFINNLSSIPNVDELKKEVYAARNKMKQNMGDSVEFGTANEIARTLSTAIDEFEKSDGEFTLEEAKIIQDSIRIMNDYSSGPVGQVAGEVNNKLKQSGFDVGR